MNKNTNDAKRLVVHRQRGITVIAVVLILIIIAFTALIAMRIIPIYLEYFNVVGALEDTVKDPKIKASSGSQQIINSIEKRFDITYVTVIKAKDVKIRPRSGNIEMELNYEDRRPLIGNLDIVAKFEKTFTLNP